MKGDDSLPVKRKVGILVTRHPSATVTSSDNSFLTLKRKATKLVSGKED